MDMKRILQAIDGVATKPVAGANDMNKFLSIIDKNNVEILNEASNPHKVSLPVQMAMQHYQKEEPIEKPVGRDNVIRKYFKEVEEELIAEKQEKRQLINQYASIIAERVLMKEGREVVSEKSTTEKQARTMAAAAHDPQFAKKLGIKSSVAKEFNKADTGTKKLSNAMKHKPKKKKVEENEIPDHSMGFTGGVGPGIMPNEGADSQMDPIRRYRMMRRISKKAGIDLNYLQLASDAELHNMYAEYGLHESKKTLKNSNPCWDGYKAVGTKKKGGRTVPNCVPKE